MSPLIHLVHPLPISDSVCHVTCIHLTHALSIISVRVCMYDTCINLVHPFPGQQLCHLQLQKPAALNLRQDKILLFKGQNGI